MKVFELVYGDAFIKATACDSVSTDERFSLDFIAANSQIYRTEVDKNVNYAYWGFIVNETSASLQLEAPSPFVLIFPVSPVAPRVPPKRKPASSLWLTYPKVLVPLGAPNLDCETASSKDCDKRTMSPLLPYTEGNRLLRLPSHPLYDQSRTGLLVAAPRKAVSIAQPG